MSSSWTPKPLFCGDGAYYRRMLQGAVAVLCLFAFTGCGQSTPGAPSSSGATLEPTGTLTPISLPPGSGDRPTAPGTTGTAKTAEGLPVLQPRGVNASRLFAEKIKDTDDRMGRLENAVQELRNDFDAMAPSIVKLVAVEKDLQGLVGQLEALVSGAPPAPVESEPLPLTSDDIAPVSDEAPMPEQDATAANAAPVPLIGEQTAMAAEVPPAPEQAMPPVQPPSETAPQPLPPVAAAAPPAAEKTEPKPAPKPEPSTAGEPAVTEVRIGEHPGKTRIVLDLSAKTDFTADLDNAEKILVVELPDAHWRAPKQKTYADSPLLASYEVSAGTNGQGSLLILKLKSEASIVYKSALSGESGKGGKIVIDIAALASAATN